MAKLELIHVDTCLPDYWGGHSLPHIQVAVTSGTKAYEVKQALRNAVCLGEVDGNSEDAQLMRAAYIYDSAKLRRAEWLTRAAYAAINRLRFARRKNIFNLSFCNDENADSVYAYFVLSEV